MNTARTFPQSARQSQVRENDKSMHCIRPIPTLYSASLRNGVKRVLDSVEQDLVIASPYIKSSEAKWVCDELEHRKAAGPIRLRVLTDVRSTNVLSGSLDIGALSLFSKRFPESVLINLPRLHAKVYVADRNCALVTSANLTPSGMDFNFEFGIEFRELEFIKKVRSELESYARLGSILGPESIAELQTVADELSAEFQKIQNPAGTDLRRRFAAKLRSANHSFLRAQVGKRSAQSVFSAAIIYALNASPLSTVELHPTIQKLLPDLCDDSVELVINGQQFGKRWKHSVRNAQQYLKRSGQICSDGKRWSLTSTPR